jgi:hypothetical protein
VCAVAEDNPEVGESITLGQLATLPRRVAMIHELIAARPAWGPAAASGCPFDAVPVQEALWWHPVHTYDLGHVWLRELAGEVGARIGAPAAPHNGLGAAGAGACQLRSRPLPQPGPRRRRTTAHRVPRGHPDPAHQAGQLRRRAARGSSAHLLSRPEMKALATLIGSFAAMLRPDPANEDNLQQWISDARTADLPHLRSFTRGLDLDIKAATAAVMLPHHNGRTEGVNRKTTRRKPQPSAEQQAARPGPQIAGVRYSAGIA